MRAIVEMSNQSQWHKSVTLEWYMHSSLFNGHKGKSSSASHEKLIQSAAAFGRFLLAAGTTVPTIPATVVTPAPSVLGIPASVAVIKPSVSPFSTLACTPVPCPGMSVCLLVGIGLVSLGTWPIVLLAQSVTLLHFVLGLVVERTRKCLCHDLL